MHPICYLTGKSGFVEKTSVAMASNPACSLKQGMTRPKVMTQRGQRADGPSPARLTHRPQCPLEPRQPLKAEPRGPASSRALRPCRAGSPTGRPELPVAHVPASKQALCDRSPLASPSSLLSLPSFSQKRFLLAVSSAHPHFLHRLPRQQEVLLEASPRLQDSDPKEASPLRRLLILLAPRKPREHAAAGRPASSQAVLEHNPWRGAGQSVVRNVSCTFLVVKAKGARPPLSMVLNKSSMQRHTSSTPGSPVVLVEDSYHVTFGKDEKRDLKRADVYPAIPLWQGAGAANRRHGLNIPSGSFGVRRGWLCKRHAYEGSVAQSL
ncbi:unnamed protein product [Rangifer tarandus platyrhynchus]|uniref:Uncharacterized protein n=1 Tax=Rangifer tarandus platyrhynchus TaxID=3082113 RepID=A0ABN8ZTN4_RANTA|nr:unnamed protein product [Rangifer tarandus platyrhynchus]